MKHINFTSKLLDINKRDFGMIIKNSHIIKFLN